MPVCQKCHKEIIFKPHPNNPSKNVPFDPGENGEIHFATCGRRHDDIMTFDTIEDIARANKRCYRGSPATFVHYQTIKGGSLRLKVSCGCGEAHHIATIAMVDEHKALINRQLDWHMDAVAFGKGAAAYAASDSLGVFSAPDLNCELHPRVHPINGWLGLLDKGSDARQYSNTVALIARRDRAYQLLSRIAARYLGRPCREEDTYVGVQYNPFSGGFSDEGTPEVDSRYPFTFLFRDLDRQLTLRLLCGSGSYGSIKPGQGPIWESSALRHQLF